MRIEKILCPIDFSECSLHAVRMASDLASEHGGSIAFVHVCQPLNPYADFGVPSGIPGSSSVNQQAIMGRELEAVKPSRPGIPHQHHLLVGDPSEEIVRLASELGSEMIVLGTHGRTGLARWILGSVSESVIRRATCPVLTCKSKPKTEYVPNVAVGASFTV